MSIQLKTIAFDSRQPGPHLLITGGVHGDEFEGPAAIRKLADHLSSLEKLQDGCVTLVPIVNEDAFLRGERTAHDGLDLARSCPGDPNGSVTEQTAHALSELIRSVTHYIDLHTGGRLFSILPMSGYMLHPDKAVLHQQREIAKAFNLPNVWGTSSELEGRSLSVARDANIPAIYAEHGGGGGCDPQGIEDYFEGCLNVLSSLGMIDRTTVPGRVESVVEDDRPQSGHMQICHPAPLTGLFMPSVKLGDQVRRGDTLGTVTDPRTGEMREIPADRTGTILVLRAFTRVLEGESVGVILEQT